MIQQVWKFTLDHTSIQDVMIPKESTILKVDSQHNRICIWALVNTSNEKEARTFEIIGTGHDVLPIDSDKEERVYLNSPSLEGGNFIFHVFEVKPRLKQ